MLLMDSSISSKWDVSASQATFFEMLSAWSASFLADMTRISRGMNHRACKEGRPCVYTFASFRQGCCVMTGFLPETGRPRIPRMNRSEVNMYGLGGSVGQDSKRFGDKPLSNSVSRAASENPVRIRDLGASNSQPLQGRTWRAEITSFSLALNLFVSANRSAPFRPTQRSRDSLGS